MCSSNEYYLKYENRVFRIQMSSLNFEFEMSMHNAEINNRNCFVVQVGVGRRRTEATFEHVSKEIACDRRWGGSYDDDLHGNECKSRLCAQSEIEGMVIHNTQSWSAERDCK